MTSSPASFLFVRALQQRGARVYTVGGTVRDELLGYPRKDLDLLVTGLPQQDLLRCLRPYGRVQLIGRAFGVIKLLPRGWDGPPIDVALPRTELSTGVGHRDLRSPLTIRYLWRPTSDGAILPSTPWLLTWPMAISWILL